jgi:hypothetical protein
MSYYKYKLQQDYKYYYPKHNILNKPPYDYVHIQKAKPTDKAYWFECITNNDEIRQSNTIEGILPYAINHKNRLYLVSYDTVYHIKHKYAEM